MTDEKLQDAPAPEDINPLAVSDLGRDPRDGRPAPDGVEVVGGMGSDGDTPTESTQE